MEFVSQELEQYCIRHSTVPSADCETIQNYTMAKVPMAVMLTGPLEGSFLQFLIKITNAKRVLEFGTFTGYSALTMAEALPTDGEVVTLDINPETSAIARDFWSKSPHGRKIKHILGRASDSLKAIRGTFDFVFIDADKTGYVSYLDLALPLLSKSGVIVADNTLFSGQVLDAKSEGALAIVAFNRRVTDDPALEHSLLPVRDGMMLIRKKN